MRMRGTSSRFRACSAAAGAGLAVMLAVPALAAPPVIKLQAPRHYSIPSGYSTDVALADYNRDGRTDVAITNSPSGVIIRFGKAGGGLGSTRQLPGGHASDYYGLAVARLNGDSRPDLVAVDESGSALTLLISKKGGGFGKRVVHLGRTPAGDVAVADLNDDGHLDLALPVSSAKPASTLAVLFGAGPGQFLTPKFYGAGPEPIQVAVGRFNSDRFPDLATSDISGDGVIAVFLGQATRTLKKKPPITLGPGAYLYGIAAGRLNGDSLSDIVVANEPSGGSSASSLDVLLGRGGGAFKAPRPHTVGDNAIGVAIGDLNGDGHPDLVATNYDDGSISALPGLGGGRFGPQKAFTGLEGPDALAIGRIDGNHSADVAVAAGGSVKTGVDILLNKRP